MYLVDTPLASGGDGPNVEGDVVTASLPGQPRVVGLLVVGVVGVLVMVVMMVMVSGCAGPTALVEGEGVDEGLALAGAGGVGAGGHKDQEHELGKKRNFVGKYSTFN